MGRHVAPHVLAMVVPGSGLVKAQAEAEGLDKVGGEEGRLKCGLGRADRGGGEGGEGCVTEVSLGKAKYGNGK